jgi:hypothetical protein
VSEVNWANERAREIAPLGTSTDTPRLLALHRATIAAALREERERCARIADAEAQRAEILGRPRIARSARKIRSRIANGAAIRSAPEPAEGKRNLYTVTVTDTDPLVYDPAKPEPCATCGGAERVKPNGEQAHGKDLWRRITQPCPACQGTAGREDATNE